MRPGSIVPLLLASSLTVDAQQPFLRTYYTSTSYSIDLIELPGNRIKTPMGAILLLDENGSVLRRDFYIGGDTYSVQSLKPGTNGELYFSSGTTAAFCPSSGSNSLIRPVLGKMDSLGHILTLKYYVMGSDLCWGLPEGLEVLDDNGAITWGREQNFFALKVDSAFIPVWSKRIDRNGGFQFIKELPGGDLLAGINMDSAGVVIARMDRNGNFLWSKSYIRPDGMVHDALIESDDSFVITGTTDSIASANAIVPVPATYQPKLFMMKLNGAGGVQWCKGFDSTPHDWYARIRSRIARSQEGNYVVLADLGLPGYNIQYRPFLMKTDPNGDTLWTRSLGAEGYTYTTRDLLVSSTGDYLISGIVYGDIPPDRSSALYVFKTDAEGRFPCHEVHHPVEVVDLFPTDSTITLSGVDSAIAHSVIVNDSTIGPNETFDFCLITTLPQYTRPSPNRPFVRPNPNTGHFTVEFADPLMAESYYSLFDTMGKLLLQRPLPTGATLEEVDLSRFGAGSYVIKFTSPDGVCYERVVVE